MSLLIKRYFTRIRVNKLVKVVTDIAGFEVGIAFKATYPGGTPQTKQDGLYDPN